MPRSRSAPERFWEKVAITPGCWLWTAATDEWGYGIFWDGRRTKAHRWAWEQENGPIPEGLILRHACDTPPCVRLDCLILGTHADNSRDCIERGRLNSRQGDLNPNRTLTSQQVEDIRRRYTGAHGEQSALAREYEVTPRTIGLIVNGKTWAAA